LDTKHNKSQSKVTPRPRTDAKRQARLVAPWFALANALDDDDPSADLLPLASKCLDAQEMANLRVLSHKRAIETIRNLTMLVCEFLYFLEATAQHKRAGKSLADPRGIQIAGREFRIGQSPDALHFAIGEDGRFIARRISLDRFFIEILPQLAPENVNFCAREKCQRLFYAARQDQNCCTPRCAQLVRQAAYNQRRKEKG
jgi:hypothetical protein